MPQHYRSSKEDVGMFTTGVVPHEQNMQEALGSISLSLNLCHELSLARYKSFNPILLFMNHVYIIFFCRKGHFYDFLVLALLSFICVQFRL